MTRPALVIVASAVLLFAPAASAKEIAHVLVVGADGRSVDVGGGWSLYDALRPAGAGSLSPPSGSYLLVYPLMRGSVPIEPARYFSDSAVGCWSWSLALEGCVASTQLPATWTATRALTPFADEPTTLKSLLHGSHPYAIPSNATVAIELALLRSQLARRTTAASRCRWSLRATWQGPAAAARPRSLCVRDRGFSVGHRLYPLSATVVSMLRYP